MTSDEALKAITSTAAEIDGRAFKIEDKDVATFVDAFNKLPPESHVSARHIIGLADQGSPNVALGFVGDDDCVQMHAMALQQLIKVLHDLGIKPALIPHGQAPVPPAAKEQGA
jgi:hypothetical protein